MRADDRNAQHVFRDLCSLLLMLRIANAGIAGNRHGVHFALQRLQHTFHFFFLQRLLLPSYNVEGSPDTYALCSRDSIFQLSSHIKQCDPAASSFYDRIGRQRRRERNQCDFLQPVKVQLIQTVLDPCRQIVFGRQRLCLA